jgi:tetratricopeptide (TPR) repeat protein
MIWTRQQNPEPGRKLERKVQNWANRAARSLDDDPHEALKQAEQVLQWSLRKKGHDSSFTIRAMNEVGNQLARQGRVVEEVDIREKMVEALRHNVGGEDDATLNAELKLATCLITLERPRDAEPLLAHVVTGRALALGDDDPQTLAAVAWQASVSKKLGRLEEALALQERVVDGYGSHQSESPQALLADLNLASTLTELHRLEAACRLLRAVLDTRTRTLGPEDPKTLEVLHVLASVLSMDDHLDEAREMAASLVDTCARVFGDEAPETLQSRDLVASIEDSLA